MYARRTGQSLLVVSVLAAIWAGYAWAAEAESKPAAKPDFSKKLGVAKVDGRKSFSGFKSGTAMQQKFNNLQRQYGVARQSGDTEKTGAIEKQLQAMQDEVRQLMMDAVDQVARDHGVSLVVGVQYRPDGSTDLEAVYHSPSVDLPDITDMVVQRINKLASTRPAFDITSQPAWAPAHAPTTRPVIRLQPPAAK